MAGQRAISATEAEMPASLRDVVVGPRDGGRDRAGHTEARNRLLATLDVAVRVGDRELVRDLTLEFPGG